MAAPLESLGLRKSTEIAGFYYKDFFIVFKKSIIAIIMKLSPIILFLIIAIITLISGCEKEEPIPFMQWHTVTLSFEGPESSESAEDNPFTNYRLIVQFTHRETNKSYHIQGFYAADGNTAESSAESGNVWQVRFKPDEIGEWDYKVSFRKGENIILNDEVNAGEEISLKHKEGSFNVIPSDKSSRDFRAHGRIKSDGKFFRFQGSKEYFLKGGADSPENFLAYADFDGTQRGESFVPREGESKPQDALHSYEPHIKDWKEGDPTWKDGKGKGMIGALNYLAEKEMNAVYFLTMNIKGDGEDVWPYTDYSERFRFDCSKLDQWDIVFDHMEKLGIMMHIVTQETENEKLLDNGDTGPERSMYYRELIARFGHHLGITWNLGEENGPAEFSPNGQNAEQQKAMANYFDENDPYDNPLVIHTHAWEGHKDELLPDLLGHSTLDGLSFQVDKREQVHSSIIKWHQESEKAGHPWLIAMDEIGMWHTGVMPDNINPNHDTMRHEVLWGSLLAGAAGVEWYFGARYEGNDLSTEDWRSRENMWNQTRYALNFFNENLPFWGNDAG